MNKIIRFFFASLAVIILVGCSNNDIKYMTNAEVIKAKDECLSGGMDYWINYSRGNEAYQVVCIKP